MSDGLTPKQKLRNHITDFHRHPGVAISRMTLKELQVFHRGQHHRYGADHIHAGPNTGPRQRPPGWSTGENMIPPAWKDEDSNG